jgi:DNA polymerase V
MNKNNPKLPLMFNESVSAGFPTPVEGYPDQSLDLNNYLVHHPSATFFVRAQGESMRDVGIFSGDILIVDRSLRPVSGNIVIAIINSEFTVKSIYFRSEIIELQPANREYQTIFLKPDDEFQIWGVVSSCIHCFI